METGEGSKAALPKISSDPRAIKSLVVRCAHDRVSSKRLQIVPEWNAIKSYEVEALGITVSFDIEYGGKDSIKAQVETMDGSGSKKARCVGTGQKGSWKSTPATFHLLPPSMKDSLWPLEIAPVSYVVTGKGGDGSTLSMDVDVFPSEKYTLTLELDPEYELIKKLNKGIKKFLEKLCHGSPVVIKPDIKGPGGSAKLSWRWAEDEKSGKAYFSFWASFGIDPIFTITVSLDVSLFAAAGMLAGIPPAIGKAIGRHTADVIIGISVSLGGKYTGTVQMRTYTTGRSESIGSVIQSITGTITIKVTAKVGSDYVISFSIMAGGTCGIEGASKLEVKPAGIYSSPRIKVLPLRVYVVTKTRALVVFSKTKERNWTLWDGADLYSPAAMKLWPLDASKKKRVSGKKK